MIKKYSLPFILLIVTIIPFLTNATSHDSGVTITDPLGLVVSGTPEEAQNVPFKLYGRLIRGFTAIMGAVALFFFILGGFKWLTSGGSEEKIRKGKDTLIWATLGLTVILSSYLILSYIISTLTTAVKTP